LRTLSTAAQTDLLQMAYTDMERGLTDLVDQVKTLCRADGKANEQWRAWCDANTDGTKDPARMDAATLHRFFEAYASGTIAPAPAAPAQGGGGGGGGGKGGGQARKVEWAELAEAVKVGQRASATWKQAWALYCEQYCGGVYDPMKHSQEVLQAFLDHLGHNGTQALQFSSESKAAWGGGWQPPAKRPRTGTPSAAPALGGGDGVATLAARIKELQRSDPAKKQQWSDFCDTHGKGVKDPSRHEYATLESFLMMP